MSYLTLDADRLVRDAVDAYLDGKLRPDAGGDCVFATRNSQYRVVEGTVIGIRAGNLVVWNGSLVLLLDKERGDIIRSYVVPQTAMMLTDKFEDGNLYAVSDRGVVVRFVPRS